MICSVNNESVLNETVNNWNDILSVFILCCRLSRFGGGVHPPKPSGETGNTQVDSSKKAKEQWLERQVADLQV